MYVCASLALDDQLVHIDGFLPLRALAGIKISSFSTSQVAFECVWTGIFTLLQIGKEQPLAHFLRCAVSWLLKQFLRDNSSKHSCHAKRPSHVL